MNAPAAAVPSINPDQHTRIKPNQILVKGRLVGMRKAGKSIAHFVTVPAPDQYSHPTSLMFFSSVREGEVENDISCLCELRGRMRTYAQTDDMGEKRQVKTVDLTMWAVQQ